MFLSLLYLKIALNCVIFLCFDGSTVNGDIRMLDAFHNLHLTIYVQ